MLHPVAELGNLWIPGKKIANLHVTIYM